MRAWRVHAYGPWRERLRLEEAPEPAPEAGGVVIRVAAAGVMFADMLAIAGEYQLKAPLPFSPGSEAAGEVLEVHPESPFAVGQRVCAVHLHGAFAERMAPPPCLTFALPDGMSYAQGAALTINYQTAATALSERARLRPGEFLLVHGGAGGVGSAAIQVGKALGATVIATAGTAEKCACCEALGADYAVNHSERDFVQFAKDLTGGLGVDCVFDPAGGDVFERSLRAAGFQARVIAIGFASGRLPRIPANHLLVKNVEVIGFNWSSYPMRRPRLVAKTQQLLYDWFESGRIAPRIGREYAFGDLPQALESIETRTSRGKAVLRGPDEEPSS